MHLTNAAGAEEMYWRPGIGEGRTIDMACLSVVAKNMMHEAKPNDSTNYLG